MGFWRISRSKTFSDFTYISFDIAYTLLSGGEQFEKYGAYNTRSLPKKGLPHFHAAALSLYLGLYFTFLQKRPHLLFSFFTATPAIAPAEIAAITASGSTLFVSPVFAEDFLVVEALLEPLP